MKGKPGFASFLVGLGVFLAAAGLYLPWIGNGFIYDDRETFLGRTPLTSVWSVGRVFSEPYYRGLPYSRPFARLGFLLQARWSGFEPAAFHAVNAVFAGLNSLLFFLILRSVSFPHGFILPCWAALGMAFHPVAASCVHPITGRETLQATGFCLLAFFAFLRNGTGWSCLSWTAFALALGTREHSVVLPFLLVIHRLWPAREDPAGASKPLRHFLPFVIIILVFGKIRTDVLGDAAFGKWAESPYLAFWSILYAVQTLFTPFATLVYEPPLEGWFSLPRSAASLSGCLLLAFLWYRAETGERHEKALPSGRYPGTPPSVGDRRSALFWFAWIVIFLLPTANLVHQQTPFDERHLFPASVGFFGLVSTLAGQARESPAVRVALAVILVFLGSLSFDRGFFFQDDAIFASRWLLSNPDSPVAHDLMGEVRETQGEFEEAEFHFKRALQLLPDFANAHNDLGILLAARGRNAEAEQHFREALRKIPQMHETRFNLGLVLKAQGRWGEAAWNLFHALRGLGWREGEIRVLLRLLLSDFLRGCTNGIR